MTQATYLCQWESVVKSMNHLKRIVQGVKLTFEEMTTVISQIETCLNSRLIVPLNPTNEEVLDVLTSGHFYHWFHFLMTLIQISHLLCCADGIYAKL